ncbi:TIGR02391 family protein [Winogradskyella psychrotolerans]|uniref:TIGR02391 family protein n=1 Tax=Winogradskyella psychrotolerans TaxID=1344585 RepID=UPI001C07499C|nr:TIGR02391 family protein [Winogradskyella psychrotolerans]MBU2922426.1 TIGR02391 family protein [Winogradskyella psychrotolerans]
MNRQKQISANILEGIAKTIGDTNRGLTGSEIGYILQMAKLKDVDPVNTKWRRIYNSFVEFQNKNQTSNNILNFVKLSMDPSRYVGNTNLFNELRDELNQKMSFAGFQISESGTLQKIKTALTLSEAEERADRLKSKLQNRNGHQEIFKFCKAELLSNNYFHAVFEATKSVAEIIRQKTGLSEDGSELIEKAFSIKDPKIQINNLATETEKSEHKGFANLIKGVFGMFRNTTAHAPKITWEINEQDALDILSTISLIHRKLE